MTGPAVWHVAAAAAGLGHHAGMSDATHATLATFRMDLRKEAEQRDGLRRLIVPGVRDAPGFLSGCWTLDRPGSESTVLVTFDSSTAAEAFARGVRANAEAQRAVGIDLLSVRVVEVTASA
jgi:hypothetical protein